MNRLGIGDRLEARVGARTQASERFFSGEAERIARLCHRMAERFSRGGRLIAFGCTPAARSDVRHIAVEFVHPVIVGKRALPAIGLGGAPDELPGRVKLLARPEDIALAFGGGDEEALRSAVLAARRQGCLTAAFSRLDAEWELLPETDDPLIAQELVETLYHVLWELVHVFFEHRGLLEGRSARAVHDPGASAFLYPFLAEQEHDLEAVLDDVTRSLLMKSEETAELRAQTLLDGQAELEQAAAGLRRRFAAGGKLLALGNGGSATDAQDLVADLMTPPVSSWRAHPAIDLAEDPAILTAIGNDVGVEAVFSRQVIAYGEPEDALVALSTSGNSVNVIEALAEARRRGLLTIAFVGYDGGQIAEASLADHVVITRSQHIPRIQEAQASAYHVLLELLEGRPAADRDG
jgi:D-sedoheptulose 7-phosphate isomerase